MKNVKIFSYKEASGHNPKEPTYSIGIFNSLQRIYTINLMKDNIHVIGDDYFFNDSWPRTWKEYNTIDKNNPYWKSLLTKKLDEVRKNFPEIQNIENLISYMEEEGWTKGRETFLDNETAEKILTNYEKHGKDFKNIIIHGINEMHLPSAVAIAMNDIYGWGIEGLREDYPEYRRFVCEKLKNARK